MNEPEERQQDPGCNPPFFEADARNAMQRMDEVRRSAENLALPSLDFGQIGESQARDIARETAESLAMSTFSRFLELAGMPPNHKPDSSPVEHGRVRPGVPALFDWDSFRRTPCWCAPCKYVHAGVEPAGNFFREDLLVVEARRLAYLTLLDRKQPETVAFNWDDLQDIEAHRKEEGQPVPLRMMYGMKVTADADLEPGEILVVGKEEAIKRGYPTWPEEKKNDIATDEAGAIQRRPLNGLIDEYRAGGPAHLDSIHPPLPSPDRPVGRPVEDAVPNDQGDFDVTIRMGGFEIHETWAGINDENGNPIGAARVNRFALPEIPPSLPPGVDGYRLFLSGEPPRMVDINPA